jgi:hypothetical protein
MMIVMMGDRARTSSTSESKHTTPLAPATATAPSPGVSPGMWRPHDRRAHCVSADAAVSPVRTPKATTPVRTNRPSPRTSAGHASSIDHPRAHRQGETDREHNRIII